MPECVCVCKASGVDSAACCGGGQRLVADL